MDECIAGEIIVLPAADCSQKSAAGILIGGFIAGRDRHTDDFAVPVAVCDLFSVVDGAAAYPSIGITVGGIAAVRRGSADNTSFGRAECDLGAVPKG